MVFEYKVVVKILDEIKHLSFDVPISKLEDDSDIGSILYDEIESYVSDNYCTCTFNESVNHCECEIEWDWNHEYYERNIKE